MSAPERPPLYWLPHGAAEFEVSQSREVRNPSWVAIKNDLSRAVYVETLDHENGPAHLAVYFTTVLIASRAKPRWHLVDEIGRPHTPESLARVSRIPASIFKEALPRLRKLGVIAEVKARRNRSKAIASEQATSVLPDSYQRDASYGTGQDRTGCNGQDATERDSTERRAREDSPSSEGEPYETRFRAAMLARGFGNPNDDQAVDWTSWKIAEACEKIGAHPGVAAMVVSDLLKSARCRGKPLEYLIAAVRSELTPRKGTNGSGLQRVDGVIAGGAS